MFLGVPIVFLSCARYTCVHTCYNMYCIHKSCEFIDLEAFDLACPMFPLQEPSSISYLDNVLRYEFQRSAEQARGEKEDSVNVQSDKRSASAACSGAACSSSTLVFMGFALEI